MSVSVVHIPEWIAENQKDFQPPVCNKCMFSDQLKVFFVGGPNSRKDYHLEEGEEFFYQKTGDMVLKVVEKGVKKDLCIKQGEIFLLPSRIEHSPQRFIDTIGFVVERSRMNTEFDCVRYFVNDSNIRLFERWFHLTDVVKDLPPLIKNFHESEECRTGGNNKRTPGPKSFLITAPYEPRNISLDRPINLEKFIEDHKDELKERPLRIYGEPTYSTEVILFGVGVHQLECTEVELIIWAQPSTYAVLVSEETSFEILGDTIVRGKQGIRYLIIIRIYFRLNIFASRSNKKIIPMFIGYRYRLEIKEGCAVSIRMKC
uniref:3-hydroxyanthranilate 3,4-dioxygenase n=1 Tax=Heterorhabditis bacteriophora TaxID=37862 RepID=A0A1I7X0J0_HETBA